MLRKETGSTSAGLPPKMARAFSRDDPIQLPENPEDLPKADATTFGAPPPPATVLEALDQRLKRYRQDESRAKEEGNARSGHQPNFFLFPSCEKSLNLPGGQINDPLSVKHYSL